MICPKCGKEIEEGKLYCEFCGEEIKIVPDFDPEIENSITQILSDVADEAIEWHSKKNSETESELSEEGDDSDEDNRLRKEFLAKNLKVDGKKLLMVMPDADKTVYLSARNLQRTEVMRASDINTYKILNADVMVITEKSLETIDGILTK